MNILLIILAAIAGLIVLLLLLALFIKKDYVIERQIIINKPKADVFNYIKYLKNQDYYSKWVMTDPGMKKTFTGADGSEGFTYAWDSNIKAAGKGEQEIKSITEGESLDFEVRYKKPFEGIANTPMAVEAIHANGTKLTWGMRGRSKYPMNLMNLFISKLLGNDLQTSLTNLKTLLEK